MRNVLISAVSNRVIYLFPIVALVVALSVKPRDRLRAPDPIVTRMIYDEFDLAAMAQRGLNADAGRLAGRLDPTEWVSAEVFDNRLDDPKALEPRYFLEYPHAALAIFRLSFAIRPAGNKIPSAVYDDDYHNLASHMPRHEGDVRVWKMLVEVTDTYVVLMAIAALGLIGILRAGYTESLWGGAWLLAGPAAAYFVLYRFDVLPAVATAAAFAALGRQRASVAGIALAVAVLLKVYPILLMPVVIRYLWHDRRSCIRFGLAFAATVSLGFAPLLFGSDFQAIAAPYRFQMTRPVETSLTVYGRLVPVFMASGTLGALFRYGCLAAVMVPAIAFQVTEFEQMLRRSALILLTFASLAVFYSPQWILWLIPLLAPLAQTRRNLAWTILALDLINYLTFPCWFHLARSTLAIQFGDETGALLHRLLGEGLCWMRFAIIGSLMYQLVREERLRSREHVSSRKHLPSGHVTNAK